MLITTNKLTGPALDWAVAKCEALDGINQGLTIIDGVPYVVGRKGSNGGLSGAGYSRRWEEAGPIIERERIQVFPHNGASEWCGVSHVQRDGYIGIIAQDGPTPLIAAMRCHVASKLGYEVDVPEELTK